MSRSEKRRRLVLALLFLAYLLSFLDRQIITILMEQLRVEFSLSDAQLGLLVGLAFASFHALFGLPLAYIADRGWSRRVITVSLALFSVATALSGFAAGFVQLLLARFVVAAGEAGANPASQALIYRYFPPAVRSRAFAWYAFAIPVGTVCGLLLGGFINEALGWRMAMITAGVPGVLVAVVLYFTLEPDAVPTREPMKPAREAERMLSDMRALISRSGFVLATLGAAVHLFVFNSVAQWIPSLFIRQYGIGTADAAKSLAIAIGAMGVVGVLGSGWVSDKLGSANRRVSFLIAIASCLCCIPFGYVLLSGELSQRESVVAACFYFSIACMFLVPTYVLVQEFAGERYRSVAVALFGLTITLIGYGAGPYIAGALSTSLSPGASAESLRQSLLYLLPCHLLGGALYACGVRSKEQPAAAISVPVKS